MNDSGSHLIHKKFLIQLSNGHYLCYENSKQAVVYRPRDREALRLDLSGTGGTVVALTADREREIYTGIRYTNKRESVEANELLEELRELNKRVTPSNH